MIGVRLVAFIATFTVFPLPLQCTTTCQVENQNDHVEGHCPVKTALVLSKDFECVTVRIWMKAVDFCEASKIEILSPFKEIIRSPMKKSKNRKCKNVRKPGQNKCDKSVSHQSLRSNTSFALRELVCDCAMAEAKSIVSVSYSTTSTSCTVNCTVPDTPVPKFDLTVNRASKSIIVTVEPGDKVHTRWCYKRTEVDCIGGSLSPLITIDPSQSRSAVLNIPHLLPCVCVQVYYTHMDARRDKMCPFQTENLTDFRDLWHSSGVTLYEESLRWRPVCSVSDLKISASLCWKQHEHLCTPVLNSTLEEKDDGLDLIYNTSKVDKHPKMCVLFSLQGQSNISCPFLADMSSWEVYIGLGKQSVFVYLTSLIPALFSAQLCVINKRGCSPLGPIHTLRMEGKTNETRINLPPHLLAKKPCVQVWQSDPALHGRRILCPDYTHKRCGIYAGATLILVVIIALLGIFVRRLTKTGIAGWLYIQKPVLLVCSSEQSAHVSAVCALASILQGELSARVHMALWAQSSHRQTRDRMGVADLGPLPWLYGQWETVCKEKGKVLIIWSPEAKTTYEKWKEEMENVDKNGGKKEDNSKAHVKNEKISDVEKEYKLLGRRLAKFKKEKAAARKDCVKLCIDKDWFPQKEPSSVIAPVFAAALGCLQGTLQHCKGQGVAIVYFQDLCHSRDIPKALRGVPRYCLPQDFRGLIQELGGMKRGTDSGKFRWHCWPRLLFKVQSVRLARQLAHRLQTLLPQMQGKKTQGLSVTSSQKRISDKTQSRLKLPLAASMAGPESVQEQEPLHGSPQRGEKL